MRRHDAVSKQAIFDEVWSDVVVSDGALSQAVRTLRRTLGDDSREPRFIRTVSRHGYQFVWAEVVEEIDDGQVAARCAGSASAAAENVENVESVAALVDRLTAAAEAGARSRETKPGTLPSGCMRWALRTPWRTSSRDPDTHPPSR